MMGKVPVSGVDFDLREETDSGSVLELLLSVSSDGDLDTVKQMLEKLLASPDFRSLRTSGEPFTKLGAALRAAVANQKLDVADYLIRSGVLITEDVVQLAVELESTKALDLLLDHGWDINDRWDRFRRPSICVALRLSSLPVVKWFLAHSASPNLQPNAYLSTTPLTSAAEYASLEINELLVSHGASVWQGDPLHAAIRSERTDREAVLRYLLGKGAPVNILEHQSNSPKLKIQLTRTSVQSPLQEAVAREKCNLVRVLVEFGADWEQRNSKGVSARELARQKDKENMIEEDIGPAAAFTQSSEPGST